MHYEMWLSFLKQEPPPDLEIFYILEISYSVSSDSYCLNDVAVNVSSPCL
jgi:hypothetical protein